ncbi:MAG: SAM-dependent methyltransferase, partial [Pseudomonadota bacterium]|nr:SAM-dependent methyltransferase [Pseudomonadota bacterium]
TSQAQFTLSGNIERLLARAQSEREYLRMAQQLKRLTLPSEMGVRFQVMALGRNIELPMAEFVRCDFRGRL